MRILYGVPSEGMGHATRSKVVIEFLLSQNHDVRIATSDRAFTYLQKYFGDRMIQIRGFHLAYKNAQVNVRNTIILSLKEAPKQIVKNFAAYKSVIDNFNPELVISDFESFSYFVAKMNRLPIISIDNMQVLNRAQLDIVIPSHEKSNYLLAKSIVKAKIPGATHYFITSFFHPEIKKNSTSYVSPIVREEILKIKRSVKNHIVVYQTSASQKDLIPELQKLPNETFYVYGFNRDEDHGNVKLKSFSEKEFIELFASSKAVISNGGFSFLSEAVYLEKPICSVPIQNQFEQFLNASYVEKLQYGRHFDEFRSDHIKAFLYDLPLFTNQICNFKHDGNQTLFEGLNSIINELKS